MCPNDSTCKVAGHVTPAIEWLNCSPKYSSCKEGGHMKPSMDWLKRSPNDSFLSTIGQTKQSTPPPSMEKQLSCSLDLPNITAEDRGSVGMSHTALSIDTTGTRLGAGRSSTRSVVSWAGEVRGAHRLGGVPPYIRTCKVATARHALQNWREASCRSIVDTYQTFSCVFSSHA